MKIKTIIALIQVMAGAACLLVSFTLDAAVDSSKLEKSLVIADQVALDALEKSYKELELLLKRHKGSYSEGTLYFRIAENFRSQAALYYRLSNSNQKYSAKSKQQARMVSLKSIQNYSIVINRFRDFDDIDLAHFFRGKLHEELGSKKDASVDYLILKNSFPESSATIPALMSLAGFASDDGKFELAISYLRIVETKKESQYYPFALYRLAWAYHNLNNRKIAQTYIEEHIKYYSNTSDQSDIAILENSLLDASLFYYEGINKRTDGFKVSSAYDYFSSMDTINVCGKMNLRFSKLLRAGGNDEGLIEFKDIVAEKGKTIPESLEIFNVTFEHQVNKNRFTQVGILAKEISDFINNNHIDHKTEYYLKSQKLILQTAESFQKLTLKNAQATEIDILKSSLASLYSSFISIIDKEDPRVFKAHYNLAETLYSVKDYTGSTQEYLWIFKNLKKQHYKDGFAKEITLKLIASRHTDFLSRKDSPIPTDLKPSLITKEDSKLSSVELIEWISWVDHYELMFNGHDKDSEKFAFDAARTLYKNNVMQDALKRLIKISNTTTSGYNETAASLILDTQINSQNWETTLELADKYIESKSFTDTFKSKLKKISSDSNYKLVELSFAQKDYTQALKRSKKCVLSQPSESRMSDCKLYAGLASLKRSEVSNGYQYLEQVLLSNDQKNRLIALKEMLSINERRFKLKESIAQIEDILKNHYALLNSKEISKLKNSVLHYTWILSDDETSIRIANSPVCENSNDICTKIQARLFIAGKYENKKTLGKNSGYLPLLLELKSISSCNLKNCGDLISEITKLYNQNDMDIALMSYPELTNVSSQLRKIRINIDEAFKITGTQSSIHKRIKTIKQFESLIENTFKLPYTDIKSLSLRENAEAYNDLATAIRGFSKPHSITEEDYKAVKSELEELLLPFEEKAQELLEKSFEIAMNTPLKSKELVQFINEFSKNNRALSKKHADHKLPSSITINIETLFSMDPESSWKYCVSKITKLQNMKSDLNEQEMRDLIKGLWLKAYQDKNHVQMAYFTNEAARLSFGKDIIELMTKLMTSNSGNLI